MSLIPCASSSLLGCWFLQLNCFPWPFSKFVDIVLVTKPYMEGENNPVTSSLLILPKAINGGFRSAYPPFLHCRNAVNNLLTEAILWCMTSSYYNLNYDRLLWYTCSDSITNQLIRSMQERTTFLKYIYLWTHTKWWYSVCVNMSMCSTHLIVVAS